MANLSAISVRDALRAEGVSRWTTVHLGPQGAVAVLCPRRTPKEDTECHLLSGIDPGKVQGEAGPAARESGAFYAQHPVLSVEQK
jgi:hypothetical protein